MPSEINEEPRAIETAMDNIGADTPAPGADTPAAAAPAADAPTDDKPAAELPAALEPAKPGAKMSALLDSMSDTPSVDKPASTPETDKPDAKPIAEQEEAELLDGVKSARGRERIKTVFSEKKQLETDIGEFRQLINDTGMKPEEFAQSLEFGRLVNSGAEADTRVALEMLEAQRTALYARLGVEAPGVDLLTDHKDLQEQVADLEITRERAVELAKFRKIEGSRIQRETQQREQQQNNQEYERTVTTAAGQMEAYLETRKNEVDHPARMRVINDHFRDPANLKQFVETYRPEQWGPTMRMMYDGIKLAAPVQREQQPLRSRPANLGAASSAGTTPIDRIASRMDQMGL